MDEVDLDPVDISLELIECVQTLLLSAPVVLVTPILDEALEICEVGAVIPPRVRKLVREARLCQPPFQVRQRGIGNLNFKGEDRLACTNLPGCGSCRQDRLCSALWVCDLDNRKKCRQDG